ncbi:RNA polymerase II associated protein 2 [Mortierella polycephala]|uniref:RNA polymerase II subunit B1 CTD phosphatase RPAP2 homolog n=1 Tax=Mortierella polycephala TaxID=41804 RepID=A0A9P6QJK3_9FUNG|nr:RNA polymerase II associated protein 2 [Mortierella polycephala]
MSRNVATMKDDIVVNKSPLIEQYLPPEPPKPSTSSTSPSASNSQSGGQTNKLNRKQMLLQHNLELRKKFEKMVLEWQEILCDPVSVETLGEAANRIKQSHYQEIIEERNIGKFCGYPLCSKPPRDIKGKYRISLSERKVYDITVLKKFCSSTCLAASRWLESQLTEEPIYLKDNDPAYLKVTRVSIVPLDMELADFQAQRMHAALAQDSKPTPAFSLPTQGLENVSVQQLPVYAAQTSSSSIAATVSPASLGNQYIQSLLASVPETPSSIKVIEHDMMEEAPREPLDMCNMDQEMREVFGVDGTERHEQQYDTVEGFRVPVRSNRVEQKGVASDTRTIEKGLAQVTLSDPHQQQLPGQPMCKSDSSMSMDTQP